MENNSIPDYLTERRTLINAVAAASGAYAEACRELRGDMGLIGKGNRPEAEYQAWQAAEAALAEFYTRYPMSVHKKAFAAEGKAYRGRK